MAFELTRFSHHRKLLIWGVAIVLALACVALARTVWRIQPLMASLHPERLPITSRDVTAARSALGPFEDVALRTADGLTLRGWYTPSRTGAVVVFVHGGGNNRAWSLPEAAELVKRGIGVLLYDSRACGESEGELQSWGDHEQNDVIAAIDYVSQRGDVDPHRIGLEGFSMGATASALVAARDQRVHAVVLNALWTSLEDELRNKSAFPKPLTHAWIRAYFNHHGVRIDQVRPIDHLAAIAPRPLVIVEGDHDEDTPLEAAQHDFAAAGEPKALWLLPSTSHGRYVQAGTASYIPRIVAFFSSAL